MRSVPLTGQGYQPASNGFSGFSQIAAGEWNRANVAAYLESEIRPLKHWLLGLAVRGEDFEDFGQTSITRLPPTSVLQTFLRTPI